MAYGSDAGADSYHAERGNTAWAALGQSLRTAARVRASDYVRLRFVGPLGLADDDARVIEATYIAAGIEAATPGFFARTYTPAEAKVLVEVKGIRWERVGSDGGMVPVSNLIDGLFYGMGGARRVGFLVI